jgi:hypothetical protein
MLNKLRTMPCRRAAIAHYHTQERCLSLLPWLTGWLEGWSASLAGAGLRPEQLLTFSNAKSEFWLYLVEMLARLAEAPDADVRAAATARLRGAVVAADGLGVLPGSLERGLRERLLPPLEALSKKVAAKSVRDMPYVDVTAAELVSVVSEAVLLHLPALLQQPGFPTLWLGLLSSLSAAAGAGNAQLSEASAAALRGLLLRLHEAVRHTTRCVLLMWGGVSPHLSLLSAVLGLPGGGRRAAQLALPHSITL